MTQLKPERYYCDKCKSRLIRTLAEVKTTLNGHQIVAEVTRPPSTTLSFSLMPLVSGDDLEETSRDLWEFYFGVTTTPDNPEPLRHFGITVFGRYPSDKKKSVIKLGLSNNGYPNNETISRVLRDVVDWSNLVITDLT